MDPWREIVRVLDDRMTGHIGQSLLGVPCELGTITDTGALKLDKFKHEIADYLTASWTAKVKIPAASRVVKIATPVNSDGSDIPGTTQYSQTSRIDFSVQGTGGPDETLDVEVDIQPGLKPGDRVLAIPVNGGQDAVVVCKVVTRGA